MNFIAHLHLSYPDPGLMVGNFVADFITNRVAEALPPKYLEGVEQHRRIDSFTDNHPSVKAGLKRLYPLQGKYALVVIDVYFDHLLCREWSRYQEGSFPLFCENVYDIFEHELPFIPQSIRRPVESLLTHRWLHTYSTMEGLTDVFRRLKKRTSFPSNLEAAASFLDEERVEFTKDFLHFYPELKEFIRGNGLSIPQN